MKLLSTLIASSAMLAVMAASANAADLYVPQQPFVPEPMSFGWTGGYVGAHVGYGWGNSDGEITLGGAGAADADSEGWLAGVQAGYNHNLGGVVIGVEGDIAWTGIEAELPNGGSPGTIMHSIDWLGTLRGRVGFAADAFLVYGTAGVAFAGGTLGLDFDDPGLTDQSDSTTHIGWVVGVGAEAMITDSISLKAEYLYHDLGTQSYSAGPFAADTSLTVSTVKIGANFHF
jgi:outer membrane immunogenic protein